MPPSTHALGVQIHVPEPNMLLQEHFAPHGNAGAVEGQSAGATGYWAHVGAVGGRPHASPDTSVCGSGHTPTGLLHAPMSQTNVLPLHWQPPHSVLG